MKRGIVQSSIALERLEGKDNRNEYMVVSIIYCYLAPASGICLAQIGDIHLNETALPVGRLRGKGKTGSDLVNTAGDSPQVNTSQGGFVGRIIFCQHVDV